MTGAFMTLLLIVLGGLALLVVLSSAVRIVREYERLIVFRMGRCLGKRGPGLVFLIPFIDKAVNVDQREEFLEIPHQTNITKDNAPIEIDFLIYWKVIDPELSVLQVANFKSASVGIATTTLRAIIGDIDLDDVLSQREHINTILRVKLDEVTERWGVKVTAVEIREIEPPPKVQDAMNRQMAAERVRRAVVTEAEGQRESTITIAEGDKQAAILRAEGEKQAAILDAEGQRTAQAVRAEGFSAALEEIWEAASQVDANTMTLQYFETLKQLAEGPATKFVFPLAFTDLMKSFTEAQRKE